MKFKNPWIDPRVHDVRVRDAESYLLRHGWEQVPSRMEGVKKFVSPIVNSGDQIILPLLAEDGGDACLRYIIELITNLAIVEDRPAVAVLEEMLQQKSDRNQPAKDGKTLPRSKKKKRAGRR